VDEEVYMGVHGCKLVCKLWCVRVNESGYSAKTIKLLITIVIAMYNYNYSKL